MVIVNMRGRIEVFIIKLYYMSFCHVFTATVVVLLSNVWWDIAMKILSSSLACNCVISVSPTCHKKGKAEIQNHKKIEFKTYLYTRGQDDCVTL